MIKEEYIWSFLKDNKLPILLYGTGDGADKLLDIFEKKGLICSDFIVSDDFYRGQTFRGYQCLTIKMAEEKYKDFVCLISFGSRLNSVIERIIDLSKRHKVLIPSIPLFGEEVFDCDYYSKNIDKIESVMNYFDDQISKQTLENIIDFRLTGKIDYLLSCMEEKNTFDFLDGDYTAYIDLGAYRGDTLEEALDKYKGIKKAICFEPAKNPFKKLNEYVNSLDESVDVKLVNEGAYDKVVNLTFLDGGGKGSHINEQNQTSKSGAKETVICMNTVDNVSCFNQERLLIKYDVEGVEMEAISGSLKTISNNKTDLVISLYHRHHDILGIPQYIKDIFPNSKLKMRKLYGIPDWDILLYVEIL